MDYKDYTSGATKEHFWFKAKGQLIDILLQKTNIKNSHILNAGAGIGEDLAIIKKYGKIYAIDIEQKALELIPENLVAEKKICDICQLPYTNNHFDIAVAFDVLEHIENDRQAIQEIYRTLKPGGVFIFTVPAVKILFSARDQALCHFRRYNKKDLRNLLSDFSEKKLNYWAFSLLIPSLLIKILRKKNTTNKVDYLLPPHLINKFFYFLLKKENFLVRNNILMPSGTTLFGIYQKN